MNETQESKGELRLLAAMWFILFSVGALGTSILAALTGTDFATLPLQGKFLIIVAIAVNYSNTMGAFISKAVSRVKAGKSIVNGDGDTAPPFKQEKV